MSTTASTTASSGSLYPIPNGLHAIPEEQLDLRPDSEVDATLKNPPPVTSSKNVWFFWDGGYDTLHPYLARTVRTWHRRFSKKGWTVRVIDLVPDSPGYAGKWINLQDPKVVPQAFREGTLDGEFAKQHYSDLVRFPLLLRYGGAYTDAGFMQIGDFDALWEKTVADPSSPYEIISYNAGGPRNYSLTNYFLASLPGNPLWQGCQGLLLKLWEGKTNTEGLYCHPLLKGLPLLGETFDNAKDNSTSRKLTDYIIQGQALTMTQSTVDEARGWDGPDYAANKVYAIEYMVGSQLINEYTSWNGVRAFELMSLKMPKEGETESEDQKLAREIVEGCLSRSFGFKLAHGMIIQVLGETLGSLWKKNPGSDVVEGTYAHWLRYGMERWTQDKLPEREPMEKLEPIKRGSLLEA